MQVEPFVGLEWLVTSVAVAVSESSGAGPGLGGGGQPPVDWAFCAGVADTPVGTVGAPTKIAAVAGDGTLVASALVAVTWKVYWSPLVRPGTVHESVGPSVPVTVSVHVSRPWPPLLGSFDDEDTSVAVTVYDWVGDPSLNPGVQLT